MNEWMNEWMDGWISIPPFLAGRYTLNKPLSKPIFKIPKAYFTPYIPLDEPNQVPLGRRAEAMCAYLRNHQQADGGWGLHIEVRSCTLLVLGEVGVGRG